MSNYILQLLTLNILYLYVAGMTEPVTVDNIDAYMSKLHATITESPQSHERLATAVRDIVGRLSVEG